MGMMMRQSEIRHGLLRNGFTPTPLNFKRPILNNWTGRRVDKEVIDSWGEMGNGTGAVCGTTAGFDFDFLDAEGVRIVLKIMREMFCGVFLERTGMPPKVLVPVHTPEPFKKIIKKFTAPDGKVHKIELLCDGQQFVVEGTHPDTGEAYTWKDLSLYKVALTHLPIVTEERAREFIDRCAVELKSKLGWLDLSGVAPESDPTVIQFAPLTERVEKMQYGGEFGINDTLLAYSGEQLRDGVPCADIIESCMARVREAYAQIPGDPQERPIWDWNKQRHQIEAMVYGYISKYHKEQPRIIETLPTPMLEKWREIETAGGTPCFKKRRYWGVEDEGPAAPLPEMQPPSEKTKRHKPANTLVPFKPFDVGSLPRRAWLYGQHYLRGVVTVTAGMGGRGKSSNSLVEAIAMATARALLGEAPAERCRVWYHCGDDNMEELLRRVAAICQHYNIDMKELEGWLFLTTPREFELRVAEGYMDVKTDEATINRIHEQIEINVIDVAILDPLVKLHGVNESGTGMDRVLGIFQAVADEHAASVEIVHHTRKNGVGHADAMQGEDDMRGSSSIHGAVRSQRLVNVMPAADAAEWQIPEGERRRYIRISTEKPNYAPSGISSWYKLVSVTIANGDNVGVVEPWQHPGESGIVTEEMLAAERKADGLFLELLDGHKGPTSSAKNSQHYAPRLFAKHPMARAAGVGELALAAAMERLLTSGKMG
jgi:hypothetical protein